ncbi:MAG: hypothetical protein ACREJB_05850 [Planctomycetaceae bacterium]
MSVKDEYHLKVLLPRSGPDEFWGAIRAHYARDDERTWRYLAMLALRECCDWPIECIGRVFGHAPGHVTRSLRQVKADLRDRFCVEPETRANRHERNP